MLARRLLGLESSLLVQYWKFLTSLLQRDFGRSYVFRQPAMTLILERMAATGETVLIAMLLAVAIAAPLGVYAGANPDSEDADLMVVDLRRAHLYPPDMALHRLVCFANGNDVSGVMVAGELVLENGRATRVQESEILEDAARQTRIMLDRIGGAGDYKLPPDFCGLEGRRT